MSQQTCQPTRAIRPMPFTPLVKGGIASVGVSITIAGSEFLELSVISFPPFFDEDFLLVFFLMSFFEVNISDVGGVLVAEMYQPH